MLNMLTSSTDGLYYDFLKKEKEKKKENSRKFIVAGK